MEEIMLTKLMPPKLAARLLPRLRLLHTLQDEKDNLRILEVTAPAGYGKTVFMQQFAGKLDKPLVWIQLDRYDNDPAIFSRYLVEGLRFYWPGLGEKALQVAIKGGAAGKNFRLVASLLANDLVRAGAEPLLVLDDAHELVEPAIHLLLQELLDNLPSGTLIAIAGRTAIPLELSTQRLTGAALCIGPAELAFSRDEIAALLEERHGPQAPEIITAIEKYSSGWPVALELSEELLAGQKTLQLPLKLKKTTLFYDYLAAEILEKLPPPDRKFLLETSVLETLTPGQCDRLLERADSAAVLKDLAKKQLLLTPLAGSDTAYRLHQLFREFLLHRLGDRRPALQRRVGRLAARAGDMGKAVDYFLLAGFDAEAEEMLEKACQQALAEGRWLITARWLEQLTDEQISAYPWVTYYRAVVELYRGNLYEAERWIEAASAAFTLASDDTGLMECRLVKARLLRCFGRYWESLALLEQAAVFKEQDVGKRFDFILEKGYNLFLSGDLPGAEKLFSGALEPSKQSGNLQVAVYLSEALGNICYQQGKHAKALQLYQWCQRISAESSLPGYYIQDAIPYIYCDWGELDKALDLAQKQLAAKERYQMIESLPSAYSTLAYVYFELGDFIKVEDLVQKALDLQHQYGEERFFFLLNQMVLAWCRVARGQWVEARQLMDETLAEAEKQVDQVCSMLQMLAGTALAIMGNMAEAGDILRRTERNLKKMNFRIRLCDLYKALAYVYYASGEMAYFQKYARKFLHLGARMNYVCNRLQFTAGLLEPILRFGLEEDLEVLYIQRMLSRLGPRSHRLILELVKHPNPAVRRRVIAPLTEMADEIMLQELRSLAQDKAPEVRQSARAYLHLEPGLAGAAVPVPANKETANRRLEVRTLGSFQLFIDGKEMSGWRTRKTRELIGLLIHLGEPVGKERLKEELWPEMDSLNSNALFGTTIYYLRRRLEQEGLADLIQYRQDRYSLNNDAFRTDSAGFEELVNAGLQQEPLQELGAGLLGKAVRHYRGDYMTEPDNYTWALPRQVRLKHLYIEALLALSRFYFSRRNYTRAQDYLLKLKEVDPLSEPAHRLLLQIQASLAGHQALVEEHRNFKLLLMEETGLPPTPETEKLFQRLIKAN